MTRIRAAVAGADLARRREGRCAGGCQGRPGAARGGHGLGADTQPAADA